MNVSDSSIYRSAGLIMDGAALFILAGMFIYTSLYRRRGKTADKVFFALILTDIIAAVFDCIKYIPGASGMYFDSALDPVCYVVYFIAVAAFAVLFCAYLFLNAVPMIRCGRLNVRDSVKQRGQILIPVLLLIAAHICLTWISLINVTPLFLSIYLMFTHLMTMRDSFYGEVPDNDRG